MPQENANGIEVKAIDAGGPNGRGEGENPTGSTAASEAGTKNAATAGRRKRRRRLKKVRISDALRHEGLDERELAKTLKGVIDRQIPAGSEVELDDKFLANMVMGCFRFFEDGPSGGGAGRLPVKLLHNVPRPKRIEKTRKTKGKGKKA